MPSTIESVAYICKLFLLVEHVNVFFIFEMCDGLSEQFRRKVIAGFVSLDNS